MKGKSSVAHGSADSDYLHLNAQGYHHVGLSCLEGTLAITSHCAIRKRSLHYSIKVAVWFKERLLSSYPKKKKPPSKSNSPLALSNH